MATELPKIMASEPITEPAVTTPEKVYDKLWLSTLVIQAFDPNEPVSVHVELVPYMDLPDGKKEIKTPSISFSLEDVFEKALTDPELAQVMGMILNYVIKAGREQGVIAPA